MARPFTWKEVPQLGVGLSAVLLGADTIEVQRKCNAHAKRAGKAFQYSEGATMQGVDYVRVTRLPDPQP